MDSDVDIPRNLLTFLFHKKLTTQLEDTTNEEDKIISKAL
jgi:hypothetical protein